MDSNTMLRTPNKSDILVKIAGWIDQDPRLREVAALIDGRAREEPVSLRLLRMKDAARETSISRTTLWRAIKEGRLQAVEVRKGSFRIPEYELRRFVVGQ